MSVRLFHTSVEPSDSNLPQAIEDSLTPDGSGVARTIDREVQAIAERLCREGYNMRDVEALMHSAVSMAVARSIIDRRRREREAIKAAEVP